ANVAPELRNTPRATVAVGQTFYFEPDFFDADGDGYSMQATFPSGMTYDAQSNLFTWTPTAADVLAPGVAHTFSLTVDDGLPNGTATFDFTIEVTTQFRNAPPAIDGLALYGAL